MFTNVLKSPAIIVCLAGAMALSACSSTGTSSSNPPSAETRNEERVVRNAQGRFGRSSLAHVKRTGEVYLMRGLLNVFSRGMDSLAGRMRARGFDAVSYNHGDWEIYAADIVRRARRNEVSYPIIIMGHSLGGNAAPQMANYLNRNGVKTDLIVAFDPTEPQVVGGGIKDVVNYYIPNGRNTFSATGGFKGKLQNITVTHLPEIKHVNVEKNRKLQDQSIDHAMRITRKLSRKELAALR